MFELFEKEVKEELNKQIELDKKNASMEQMYIILNLVDSIESTKRQFEYLNFRMDDSQIKKLFISVYKDTYTMKDVSSFEAYANLNIRKLIYEYLDLNKCILSSYAINMIDYLITEYNSNGIYQHLTLEVGPKSSEPSSHLSEYEKSLLDGFITDGDNSDQYYLTRLIIALFNKVMGIMYLIILSREKYKFIDNSELVYLAKELYEDFEEEEAIDKLFDIYKETYDQEFKNIEDNNYVKRKKLNLELIVRASFEDINFNFFKKLEKRTTYGAITYVSKFKSLYEFKSFDILKLMLADKGEYEKTDKLNKEDFEQMIYYAYKNDIYKMRVVREFYSSMIINYIDILKTEDLINIIFNFKKFQQILNDNNYSKKSITTYEEKSFQEDKLSLSNINSGIEFENYLKYVFEKMGYDVELTKASGDQGADLIISKGQTRTAVQAKFYSTPVGNKAIQEVVASMKVYNANSAMVVTNNYYTNAARCLAKLNGVSLWDKDVLENMVLAID